VKSLKQNKKSLLLAVPVLQNRYRFLLYKKKLRLQRLYVMLFIIFKKDEMPSLRLGGGKHERAQGNREIYLDYPET